MNKTISINVIDDFFSSNGERRMSDPIQIPSPKFMIENRAEDLRAYDWCADYTKEVVEFDDDGKQLIFVMEV